MNAYRRLAAIALVTFGAQGIFFRGYVTDDTWIYARFAENLARFGELSFWPGEPVHAATSPLWAAMAAMLIRLGIAPIDALWGLGWACGAGAVVVFARLAHRILGGSGLASLAALGFATEVWFVRWSASGMETSLAVLWLLVAMDLSWRPISRVPGWRLGLWLGGGFLIRPESLALVALLTLSLLREPQLRRRWSFWIGLLAIPVAWSAYALPSFGHVLPATLQAKSTPLGWQPLRALANVKVLLALYLVSVPVATGLWWWQIVGAWRRPAALVAGAPFSATAWWAWSAALPLAYLVRDVQVVSRYLEAIVPVLPLLVLERWWRSSAPRPSRRGWLRGVLAAQVVVSLALTSLWIAPRSRDFGRTLTAGLGDISEWIRENSSTDEVVAVYDIGFVGAHCQRRILDLGGLIEPGISDLRDRVDDAEILRRGLFLEFATPSLLIDRDFEPNALEDWRLPGYRLEPVLHRRVANLGLSRPEPVVYTLYRLRPR